MRRKARTSLGSCQEYPSPNKCRPLMVIGRQSPLAAHRGSHFPQYISVSLNRPIVNSRLLISTTYNCETNISATHFSENRAKDDVPVTFVLTLR